MRPKVWRTRDWLWLAATAGLVGWSLYLWISQGRPLSIEFGTLPDYLTAVVAFGALVFAAISARASHGQREIMQQELDNALEQVRDDRLERRARQARMVTIYPLSVSWYGWENLNVELPLGFVHLWNRSDEPVYALTLCVTGRQIAQSHNLPLLMPTGEQPATLGAHLDTVLLDVHKELEHRYPPLPKGGPSGVSRPEAELDLSLLFSDADGVRWHRGAWGLLEVPTDYGVEQANAWVEEKRARPYN